MLQIASECLAHGDPRTTQDVYRLKPRRARYSAYSRRNEYRACALLQSVGFLVS